MQGAAAQRAAPAAVAAKASAAPTPLQWGRWLRAARDGADDPAWPMSPVQRRVLLSLASSPSAAHSPSAPALVSAPGLAWQWQPGSPPPPDPSIRELHWRSREATSAQLRIEPTGLRWIEGDLHWFAAVDAATLQALLREF